MRLRHRGGRLEVDNVYDKKGASADDEAVLRLEALLDTAMTDNIQAALPPPLQATQTQALGDWFAQPPATFTSQTDN